MNPNTFALLENDFMASINDADKMIDFYQRNALFLNNIKSVNDKDDLLSFMQIINKYASALWQKKRFTKAVELVDDRLPVIDQEIARLNASELKGEVYYAILFFKAASLNSNRNFKAAHPLFLRLTQHDPENELFKTWLKHTDNGLKMGQIRIVSVSGVFLIVVAMILSVVAPNFRQRSLLVYTGFVIMLGAAAYEYYLKYKFDKNK